LRTILTIDGKASGAETAEAALWRPDQGKQMMAGLGAQISPWRGTCSSLLRAGVLCNMEFCSPVTAPRQVEVGKARIYFGGAKRGAPHPGAGGVRGQVANVPLFSTRLQVAPEPSSYLVLSPSTLDLLTSSRGRRGQQCPAPQAPGVGRVSPTRGLDLPLPPPPVQVRREPPLRSQAVSSSHRGWSVPGLQSFVIN
jgi:hypothetical protein